MRLLPHNFSGLRLVCIVIITNLITSPQPEDAIDVRFQTSSSVCISTRLQDSTVCLEGMEGSRAHLLEWVSCLEPLFCFFRAD